MREGTQIYGSKLEAKLIFKRAFFPIKPQRIVMECDRMPVPHFFVRIRWLNPARSPQSGGTLGSFSRGGLRVVLYDPNLSRTTPKCKDLDPSHFMD